MIQWHEITALLWAIWNNGISLLSGVLGVVFTVLSVFFPDKQKRYFIICGIIALLLSPIVAWLDEYRAHRSEAQRLTQEKKTLTEQFENDLKKLSGDEKFRRAMMRPTVELSFYYGVNDISWKYWNSGPGVGIVRWLSVSVDGVPKQNWREALSAIGGPRYRTSPFFTLKPLLGSSLLLALATCCY
jgi:hypothetical protein